MVKGYSKKTAINSDNGDNGKFGGGWGYSSNSGNIFE